MEIWISLSRSPRRTCLNDWIQSNIYCSWKHYLINKRKNYKKNSPLLFVLADHAHHLTFVDASFFPNFLELLSYSRKNVHPIWPTATTRCIDNLRNSGILLYCFFHFQI